MRKSTTILIAVLGLLSATQGVAEGQNQAFAIMWMGKVHDGVDLKNADELIANVAETVAQNEGTLRFEISRVGEHLFGYERFADQAGFLAQIELVGPLYPQINETWAPTIVVPTTAIPTEVGEMLKGFNALVPDHLASSAN